MALKQTPELEEYLHQAVDKHASDVHLVPGEPVCFRVAGKLERTNTEPLTAEQVHAIAAAAVGEEALQTIGPKVGGVRTGCGLPGVVSAELSVARSVGAYTVVLRIYPQTILDIKAAGMPEAMVKAAESSHGLVVVAGPTGSGKTTSVVSLVDYLNATKVCHICTVEDPILIHFTPKQAIIQQREVGTDVPDTVAGIASALVQDLDVLYVSELKRAEEVSAAISSAEAGHMVIFAMHGESPEDAVQRLIDVFPPEEQRAIRRRLAGVLRAVSVQVLLRKATGKGRVAAYGVLIPDDATRRAIVEGRVLDASAKSGPGCQTLAEGIQRLRDAGTVSAEEAERVLASLR
jgi:twitching motility protein PilT